MQGIGAPGSEPSRVGVPASPLSLAHPSRWSPTGPIPVVQPSSPVAAARAGGGPQRSPVYSLSDHAAFSTFTVTNTVVGRLQAKIEALAAPARNSSWVGSNLNLNDERATTTGTLQRSKSASRVIPQPQAVTVVRNAPNLKLGLSPAQAPASSGILMNGMIV